MPLELTGLQDTVAVVTGAGRMRGIGRAIALELARGGCDVVVTGTPIDLGEGIYGHSRFFRAHVTYYFPNAAVKQTFDAAPARYVPALNGDCIVCYEKAGKRVPGSIRFASLHRGRLLLFPSEAEKRAFNENPAKAETPTI